MPIYAKNAVVGTDAFFREIHVGDEIQDLDGRRYTIDQFGRCKPLDGGNVVPLRNVKEASVVGAAAPKLPVEETPSGKIVPVKVTGPSGDVPTKEEVKCLPALDETPAETRETPKPAKASPIGARGPKSNATREAMSKGRNKSGAVQLYNLLRGKGFNLSGTAARQILEGAGFKTFTDAGQRTCIARDDYARALEELGKWVEDHRDDPEWPALERKRREPEPEPVLEPGPVRVVLKGEDVAPVLGKHVEPPRPISEDAQRIMDDDCLPGFTPDTCTVREAPDQMLANELRRRGYKADISKLIVL